MDQTLQDLPDFEIEIEVTTSESPPAASVPVTPIAHNHVNSPGSLESILTPESNHTEPESHADNVNNSSNSILTHTAHLPPPSQSEAAPVFSVPLSPCSSSSQSIRNSPALSTCSDSSVVGGSGGIPVIQWASKVKLEDAKTKMKNSREPQGNNKPTVERKLDGCGNGSVSEDSSDDVVYIGEYRSLVVPIKKTTPPVAAHNQNCPQNCPQNYPKNCTKNCPQCFYRSSNAAAAVSKKFAVSSETLGSQRFNPMRWQNSGVSRFANPSVYESFWNASKSRQNCNICQQAPPVSTFPALFPEPPESEWPYVRVNHMEPKLEVNIRSYTNQF